MDVSTLEDRQPYQTWLSYNTHAVIQRARCLLPIQHCDIHFQNGPSKNPRQGPIFTERWSGPFNHSAPMQQTSVFDLFVAAITPNTTCSGVGCTYDPPTSSTGHLTCDNNPCPTGWPCCTWQNVYSTCCMPGQKCVDGGCY